MESGAGLGQKVAENRAASAAVEKSRASSALRRAGSERRSSFSKDKVDQDPDVEVTA